jgi:hypothetical protein
MIAASWPWPLSELEDDAGRYLAGKHFVDGFVDLVQLAVGGDDARAPGRVESQGK